MMVVVLFMKSFNEKIFFPWLSPIPWVGFSTCQAVQPLAERMPYPSFVFRAFGIGDSSYMTETLAAGLVICVRSDASVP